MIRFGTRTLVLLAALSSVACTTLGPSIDNGKVASIQPGVTTQAQIQARFGIPYERQMDSSGASRWVYVNEDWSTGDLVNEAWASGSSIARTVGYDTPRRPRVGGLKGSQRSSLEIAFDANGVVTEFAYSGI